MKLIAYNKILIFLCVCLLSIGVFVLAKERPISLFIVRSGSMAPTIPVGSLILTSRQQSYRVGDIVTYTRSGRRVTHRIEKVENTGYRVKGDANSAVDKAPIQPQAVLGRTLLIIPGLGRLLFFPKTPWGYSLLILLPALLLITRELRAILRELAKNPRERPNLVIASEKSERSNLCKRLPRRPADGGTPRNDSLMKRKGLTALSILLILSSLIPSSSAYFSSEATSNANTFTAALHFPHLVINEIYYNPCSGCGGNPQNEWVELYNPTASAVTLTGWSLTDNSASDTLPADTIIPSHGFLVVTPQASTFTYWPTVEATKQVILGSNIGNGLADSGDQLTLKDNTGATIDALSYGNNINIFNPAIPGVAKGHSIERQTTGVDTDATADFVDRSAPTPGS